MSSSGEAKQDDENEDEIDTHEHVGKVGEMHDVEGGVGGTGVTVWNEPIRVRVYDRGRLQRAGVGVVLEAIDGVKLGDGENDLATEGTGTR